METANLCRGSLSTAYYNPAKLLQLSTSNSGKNSV